jgi:hypothetical protein
MMTSQYAGLSSIKYAFLEAFSAAINVVPEPPKGSKMLALLPVYA